MDYQRFLNQLPAQYENWGQDTVRPKSPQFQQALTHIQGMTTTNVMQLLNFAVACLEPDEVYCEIGTFQGSTLVGALLNHPEKMAYAVDNFSEFDEDGSCSEALINNLNQFGLEEQVYFSNQDFQQFFLELQELGTEDKFGIYFYDGAHDYRSTLLGLLLAKPFLSDTALIILDDANWGTVQQACWDFLALSPEAKVELELFTPVARFPTFWNGIQVLSWNRQRQTQYAPSKFSEKNRSSVIKAIYNLQLLEQREESIAILYQEALQFHQQKQYSAAEKQYQEYLLWREEDSKAWCNLGLLYFQTENFQESYKAIQKALELDLHNGTLYYYLGNIFTRIHEVRRAILAYQKAIELEPTLIDAYNNLGLAFNQIEAIDEAKAVFREAIVVNSNFFGTYLNLGNLFLEQADFASAIQTYQAGLEVSPSSQDLSQNLDFALSTQAHPLEFHRKMGQSFYQQQKYQTAKQHLQQYLELQPDAEEAYLQLSNCLSQLNDQETTIAVLKKGVQHHPASEQLNYELILKLSQIGHAKESIEIAESACAKTPDSYTLNLLKSLTLPWIYDSVEELEFYHNRYLQQLNSLTNQTTLETAAQKAQALAAIGRFSSFQFTYQARAMLEPQQQYGRLVEMIMAANYPQWTQAPSMPPVEGKIRIGYLTHYFHSYSGTLWLTGWLRHANHQNFEIYCYYTGNEPDAITQEFQTYSDVFHHIPADLEAVCQQVLGDRLHLLIFPEIGMDPLTVQLAALRLAPIQCTAWGHPVTSGLSTVDYYLSSELMEPDNGQEHYSETLIRLPNLGIAYPQPTLPPLSKTRTNFGLREDAVVYFCGQAPFKYLPQHDYLLVEIARRVPSAQFVFIRADILQPRLKQAFAMANLNVDDFCVFLPVLSRHDYLMLNLLADGYLDTLGFTGGNTTMDAIACGLPVITCPQEFMRGRMSYGILRALGLAETIAQTEQDYIELAVKLALDPDWKAQISQAMLQQQYRVFDDTTCIPALESFYCEIVQAANTP